MCRALKAPLARVERRDHAVQTILYVSSMTLGDEVPVRQLHEAFPVNALERGHGVEKLTAFIGSGFYALELVIDDETGAFQERFHDFLRTPELQEFFAHLRAHVDELPTPESQTAELHLATPLLQWERGMAGSS
jgi:hypothetical protein